MSTGDFIQGTIPVSGGAYIKIMPPTDAKYLSSTGACLFVLKFVSVDRMSFRASIKAGGIYPLPHPFLKKRHFTHKRHTNTHTQHSHSRNTTHTHLHNTAHTHNTETHTHTHTHTHLGNNGFNDMPYPSQFVSSTASVPVYSPTNQPIYVKLMNYYYYNQGVRFELSRSAAEWIAPNAYTSLPWNGGPDYVFVSTLSYPCLLQAKPRDSVEVLKIRKIEYLVQITLKIENQVMVEGDKTLDSALVRRQFNATLPRGIAEV